MNTFGGRSVAYAALIVSGVRQFATQEIVPTLDTLRHAGCLFLFLVQRRRKKKHSAFSNPPETQRSKISPWRRLRHGEKQRIARPQPRAAVLHGRRQP